MKERRVDGFFYGLFMDSAVLRSSGVSPENPRQAYVDGFRLRIGHRATLLPAEAARAYGMVIALTHAELEHLYRTPGLDQYRPEAVLARLVSGGSTPALCYNLRNEPQADERNAEYAARLQSSLRELGFPPEYIEAVARC